MIISKTSYHYHRLLFTLKDVIFFAADAKMIQNA